MEGSLKSICEALRDARETDLADKLSGALSTIEDNTSSEKSSHTFLPNNAGASLNVPAFISFITILEKYASAKKHRLSIIHDKTKAYERGYAELYRLYSQPDRFEFPLTDGSSLLMGFSHLKNICFKESKESPWIQSADVLISGLNRFLKAVYKDEFVNPELLELGKYVSPAIFDNIFKRGDSVCSNEIRKKIRDVIQETNMYR